MTKTTKKDEGLKKSIRMYKSWERFVKKLEKEGLRGTDWYINRVEELEKEVEILKKKLKKVNA